MTMTEQQSWDLTDIYQNMTDPAIEQDFKKVDRLVIQLEKYRGKIVDLSSTELLTLIQTWEELSLLLHRFNLFAGLLESTHTGIAEYTRFSKQIEEQSVARQTKLLFIETELAQLPAKTWQQHQSDPVLKPYQTFLRKLSEQAKHTLSENEEKILAEKSQTSTSALLHLFALTTDTLEFKADGKKITLEELLDQFHHPEPAKRKAAARTLHAGLETNAKTTPAILNSLVQDKSLTDRLRGYQTPEQARLMSDDVEPETVQAMVSAVTQSYDQVTRYYELKKRLLGLKELSWWDRYAPLPKLKTTIPQSEAVERVLTAFGQFSPEMAKIAQTIIEQNHVDWQSSPTKRGGAFCAYGDSTLYPYILLNYTNSPRDVMTLAHELGHGVHNVLGAAKNRFFQSESSLALAEIASVFGETILFEQLISSPLSQTDKASLLMAFIEDRFATVYRQTTMFQFEQQLHQQRRVEGELAKEQIDELWHQTMKAPFNAALTYTDEHKNSWMYVGHIFHWPFYVYSYAFAQLCVLALYQSYKTEGSAFRPRYLAMLRAGGSLSPKENLAQAGYDINQADFWQQGLTSIDQFIDELEQLS